MKILKMMKMMTMKVTMIVMNPLRPKKIHNKIKKKEKTVIKKKILNRINLPKLANNSEFYILKYKSFNSYRLLITNFSLIIYLTIYFRFFTLKFIHNIII
jgi:hypothetical protein